MPVAGSPIKLQTSIKNLGVYLDSRLSFDKQVSETCKASYFHIRALRHIRSSLTVEAAKTVATAIVESRLDYCNSLLAGTSVSNLSRLQLVQNTLARVVAQKSRFDHITPVLSELHWLPVRHRINFKIAAITHTVLQTQQPSRCPPTSPHSFRAMHLCDRFALLRPCRYVFLCAKPPWQPLDRSRLSHQKFGMHCRVISHPSQLFLLSEELSNTIFLVFLS